MAEYGHKMRNPAPRSHGAIDRALRRHFVAAMERFESLYNMPTHLLPITSEGRDEREHQLDIAEADVKTFRELIEDLNKTGDS